MDKILITGAAGFLGSNIIKQLIENQSVELFGIDNFTNSSISTLYPYLKNERFTFFEQNAKDEITFAVDKIYHFAGSGDLTYYKNNKYDYVVEQIEIIKNLLNYTKITGAKLVCVFPFCDYQAHNRDNFMLYDMVNLLGAMIFESSKINKTDCKIVRLAQSYGQNCAKNDKSFITDTIMKAFNNEDIELESDEETYVIYSKDATKALIKVMDNITSKNLIDVSPVNLTLKSDIIRLILTFLKSKSRVYIKGDKIIYPKYVPNIEILTQELEFRCTTPILDGISKTIDFIKLMYFS